MIRNTKLNRFFLIQRRRKSNGLCHQQFFSLPYSLLMGKRCFSSDTGNKSDEKPAPLTSSLDKELVSWAFSKSSISSCNPASSTEKEDVVAALNVIASDQGQAAGWHELEPFFRIVAGYQQFFEPYQEGRLVFDKRVSVVGVSEAAARAFIRAEPACAANIGKIGIAQLAQPWARYSVFSGAAGNTEVGVIFEDEHTAATAAGEVDNPKAPPTIILSGKILPRMEQTIRAWLLEAHMYLGQEHLLGKEQLKGLAAFKNSAMKGHFLVVTSETNENIALGPNKSLVVFISRGLAERVVRATFPDNLQSIRTVDGGEMLLHLTKQAEADNITFLVPNPAGNPVPYDYTTRYFEQFIAEGKELLTEDEAIEDPMQRKYPPF